RERDIDWTRLAQVSELRAPTDAELAAIRALAEQAANYLRNFGFEALGTWYGTGLGEKLGVFLCEVEPEHDAFHWVIVGDVPPAVISPRFARNYVQALDGYVAEMTAWADAAEAGKPLDEFIPVAAAPTPDHIAKLRSRLAFIAEHFIRPQERLLAAPVAADRREDAAGA
ncbi:MAG TPA: hypothetical protein VFF65_04285, partial [Phycisphaerales bacterium]|nr:hypothetical protein [Phycisphaerales bacterium]